MDKAQPDEVFSVLLADPRSALRPPRPGQSLAAYRARLDAPMAAVAGPAGIDVEPIGIAADARPLRLRRYRPPTCVPGTILFLHGGGFVVGSLDTHDALCRSIAMASGRAVVAIDYRLAPEARFPAALDDARTALAWITAADGTRPIGLCGDSAGGHLAAGVALGAASDGIAVAAACLLYPVVSPSCGTESWRLFGEGHLLTREWMRWAWSAYRGDGSLPSAEPPDLLAADLSRMPPTLVVTAGCDPLRDEGEALAAAIRKAGGQAAGRRFGGMIHGFASLPMLTPRAGEAVRDCATFFYQHMR